MKRFFNKIILIFLLIIIQMIPVSNAVVGGSVNVDKTEVKQGETFNIYVTLDVVSEAYDIKFEVDKKELIATTEVVPTVSGNKLSGTNRIYLIQIDEAENRTKYPVGTKVACMRYKVSDTATIGDEVEIIVIGDIVGENNSENSIYESKKIKIVRKEKVEDEKQDDQDKKDDSSTDEKLPNTGKRDKINSANRCICSYN